MNHSRMTHQVQNLLNETAFLIFFPKFWLVAQPEIQILNGLYSIESIVTSFTAKSATIVTLAVIKF